MMAVLTFIGWAAFMGAVVLSLAILLILIQGSPWHASRRAARRLRCWTRHCPGSVISGIHDNWIWIGWQCRDCSKVKHYERATELPQRLWHHNGTIDGHKDEDLPS
jgi:hypothetical protein